MFTSITQKIAVVLPCYKVSRQLERVLVAMPPFVDFVIVVDDACPEKSGKIAERLDNDKIFVIYHTKNRGVGGAVISGYKKALELNSDIVVKLDGDGQMNPEDIEILISPLTKDMADYAKGNRFHDFHALKSMPKSRLFGNSFLSFAVKVASGYWNTMDPTNGFCAITSEALNNLNLKNIDERYFFETDMLINLNINEYVVQDVPVSTKYSDETSNLSIGNTTITFPPKIIKGFVKRIFYKYYLYNFNMASIYLLLAIPLLVFGACFGVYKWTVGLIENVENNSGTIMLVALPVILGVQFLLQAISIDINNLPKRNGDGQM